MLTNKVAIITGAGRGVGREIAAHFVDKGAKVVLVARSADEIEKLADKFNGNGEEKAMASCCDIRRSEKVEETVAAAVKKFGAVDILVNNAGINHISSVVVSDEAKWREVIETNLLGTYLCCKHVVRQMLKQRGGRIVNIASISARKGVPFCSAYSASKAGVLGLTRTLAVELAKERICVNAICPGAIEGYLSEHAKGDWVKIFGIKPEEFQKKLKESIPQKKFMDIKDVVKLTAFLSSDAMGGITGQAINIDGGGSVS